MKTLTAQASNQSDAQTETISSYLEKAGTTEAPKNKKRQTLMELYQDNGLRDRINRICSDMESQKIKMIHDELIRMAKERGIYLDEYTCKPSGDTIDISCLTYDGPSSKMRFGMSERQSTIVFTCENDNSVLDLSFSLISKCYPYNFKEKTLTMLSERLNIVKEMKPEAAWFLISDFDSLVEEKDNSDFDIRASKFEDKLEKFE